MTPVPRRGSFASFLAATGVLLATLLAADPAAAQFGRGGRGGGGGSDPLRVLRDDAVRDELQLTDAQVERLDALAADAGDSFAAMGEFRQRLQDAATDEEQQAVRDEMAAAARERTGESRRQVADVLDAGQNSRLDQILLQRRGVTAMLEDDALAERFGLTDAQRAAMEQVQEDRRAALQERGFAAFRDPDFRAEWDAKTLAVLDAGQSGKWRAATGPALDSDGGADRGRGDRREGRRGGPPAAAATAPPAAAPPAVSEPPAPTGEAVAEIDARPRTPDAGAGGTGTDVAAGPEVMSFTFRDAPWEDVLRLIADFAGSNLDLEAVPPGTFSYRDPNEYTAAEAVDVLNGFLLQRGYVLVRRDNFLISVNIDRGIPPNLVPDVSLEELPNRGTNELVRVIVPLKTGSAADVVGEAESLLGPQGTVSALTSANALVVRDTGGNVRRVVSLLTELSGGALQFRQFTLKHLDAYDAEILVRAQLGLGGGPATVAAFTDDRDRGRSRSSSSNGPEPNVTADERTNSLLVTATQDQLRIAEEVLEAVDVAEGADGQALSSSSRKPFFKSYRLERSDAREVAKTVDAMYPGSVVNEDGRARSIQIYASGTDQEKIEAMIRQIDGTGGGDSMVSVIPLARMDPTTAAYSLLGLFAPDGEDAPVIQPDAFGRRLLVRGTPEQVEQVKLLLTQLGEDGSGTAAGGGGPIRTLNLGGRDPEEFLPVLERLWGASRTSPLRVVPPNRPPVIERADPQVQEIPAAERRPAGRTSGDGDASVRLPIANPLSDLLGRPSFAVQDDLGDATVETPAAPAPSADETPTAPAGGRGGAEPVSVSYADGKLILYSEDEAALDDVEELVARLGEVLPARSRWNLYYLTRVDATETAELLEQLFPTASVSGTGEDGSMMGSLATGVSTFGSSLMDLSGVGGLGMSSQTLRIVPDVSKNALFFTGPPEQVRQVEEVLNTLDGTRPGENLRERVPRMIPVRYADVQEVADLVTELYEDYTADGVNQMAQALGKGGGGRGGGGGNPLAMLLGGGAGGSEQPVRLSVGVDTRTSQLVVSAAEPLFREIEELVRSLDDAARDAKRGVQFVTLRNADAATVQATLGSLMPQVNSGGASTVRPSRTTGSSRSSSGSERGSGGDSSDDPGAAIRQMMIMRAMQGRGGGEGGSPFGGGRGGRGGDSGGDSAGRGGGSRGGGGRGR